MPLILNTLELVDHLRTLAEKARLEYRDESTTQRDRTVAYGRAKALFEVMDAVKAMAEQTGDAALATHASKQAVLGRKLMAQAVDYVGDKAMEKATARLLKRK